MKTVSSIPHVLLVYPRSKAVTVMPPLGIGYLAGAIAKKGIPVSVVDLNRLDQGWPTLKRIVQSEKPDFIGVSVSTPNYLSGKRLVSMIKALGSEGKILLGGPHASALKARALEDFRADILFLGEAEHSLGDFLDNIISGRDIRNVAGLIFNGSEGIDETAFPGFFDNLDELPFPLWEQLDPRRYPPIPHQMFVRHLPVAPILTTRGCPFNCYFCSSTGLYGEKLRKRSAENVVEEMDMLVRDFGVREFHMEDDCLTLDRGHITRLCEKLIANGDDRSWKTPNGLLTRTLERDLLVLMKRAGCYQISLGIETLSQQSVDQMGKRYEVARLEELLATASDIGLETHGLFILGLPGEDPAEMRETIRRAPKLGLDLAHFSLCVPLPGSKLGDSILSESEDFAGVNFFNPHLGDRKKNRLAKSLQRRAILRFYLRWRPLRLMWRMFMWRQFVGVLRIIRYYLLR